MENNSQTFFEWVSSNSEFISLFLSIITVLASIIAIIISVKTAMNQNKIALFEKRHIVYEKYVELSSFRECLKISTLPPGMPETPEIWRSIYINAYLTKSNFNNIRPNLPIQFLVVNQIKEDLKYYEQLFYLFKLKKTEKEDVEKMLNSLENLISAFISEEMELEEIKNTFEKYFDRSSSMIMKIIEENLQIHTR